MDVCDIAGDKVGTIAHVYRFADAVVNAGPTTEAGERPAYEDVIEVKTGFLGLGSHLYIPLSAVQDTLEDCVFLSRPKHEFERLGWNEKPAHLDALH
jgi:hypothetical protein